MLVIADGNNLAWAAFHSLGKAMGAETPEEKTRATLLGLTQSIIGPVARGGLQVDSRGQLPLEADPRYPPITGLAVAFDHGRPHRRREVWPAYQTGREHQPAFIDNEPYVLDAIQQFCDAALACMPVTVLRGENTEADDLAAALTLQAEGLVRIASSDRDFLQLVDTRVSIYSVIKKVLIDDTNFDDEVLPRDRDGEPIRFPRERFVDYRALVGDSSDDLPGVPGIGTLTAARLLAAHPLDAYLDDPALVEPALGRSNKRVQAAFEGAAAREIIARNRALMDLRAAAERYTDLSPYVRLGSWDERAFRQWIEELRAARLDTEGAVATIAGIAARAGARG